MPKGFGFPLVSGQKNQGRRVLKMWVQAHPRLASMRPHINRAHTSAIAVLKFPILVEKGTHTSVWVPQFGFTLASANCVVVLGTE